MVVNANDVSSRTSDVAVDLRAGLVIDASEALRRKSEIFFLDVRGGTQSDLLDYEREHLPGAVYASVKEVFAAPASVERGNLPLPDIDALQKHVNQWGVGADADIVVYGTHPAIVARGWWVLRWAGLSRVRFLNGGLDAWIAAGGPVQAGASPHRDPKYVVTLTGGHLPTVDANGAADIAAGGVLIDGRSASAFAGGADGRSNSAPGHIPGAWSFPASQAWDDDGKLRSAEELIIVTNSIGIAPNTEIAAYCGSGVLAAYTVLALLSLGITASLYVGSWSQWSADPDRPRAYGDIPR